MARIIQTQTLDPKETLSQMDNDWIYNGLDCCVTLEIEKELKEQCDETSEKIYQRSLSLQAPVLEMSLRGIKIDQNKRDETLLELQRQIVRLEEQFYFILENGLGITINRKLKTKYWRSTKNLCDLFYHTLELKPILKRNQTGKYMPTVDEEALEKLAVNFYAEPLCNHLLVLRDYDKQRQFLETEIDEDGRMRAGWNIAGTNTGRFSCNESAFKTGRNQQNIDKRLREPFVADEGYKLGNIDLEQADARNVGAVCWQLFVNEHGEKFAGKFLDYCESGDLHTKVCEMGWPELEWTTDEKQNRKIADHIAERAFSYRDLAKKLGHGSNYQGIVNVANSTKLPMAQVLDFQKKYYSGFPTIPLWHDWVANQLKTMGYITTLMGRRRYFFGRHDDKNNIRAAVAFEPQSVTGDILNEGLINLFRSGLVQILAQVHDSILFQYPIEQEDEIIPQCIDAMTIPIILEKGREFIVPVEAKIGWNWGDRKHNYDTGKIDNEYGLKNWDASQSDDRTAPSLKKKKRLNLFRDLV